LEIIAWFDGTDEDSVLGQPDYSATFDIPTSEQEFVISFTEPAVPDHYYWDFEIRLIEDIPGKPKKTYAPRLIGLDLEVLRPQLRGGNLRGMTFPIVCIPPFGEGEVPIVVP
jgi:hypothetical protein